MGEPQSLDLVAEDGDERVGGNLPERRVWSPSEMVCGFCGSWITWRAKPHSNCRVQWHAMRGFGWRGLSGGLRNQICMSLRAKEDPMRLDAGFLERSSVAVVPTEQRHTVHGNDVIALHSCLSTGLCQFGRSSAAA